MESFEDENDYVYEGCEIKESGCGEVMEEEVTGRDDAMVVLSRVEKF